MLNISDPTCTQDRDRDRDRDRERDRNRDRDRRYRTRDRSEVRKHRTDRAGDRDREQGRDRAADQKRRDVRSGNSEKRQKEERMTSEEEAKCEETRIRSECRVDPGNEKIPECISLTIGSSLLPAPSTSSCSPATRDLPFDKRQAQEQKRKQLWNKDQAPVSMRLSIAEIWD